MLSLYDNLALHYRMKRAEIRVFAGLSKAGRVSAFRVQKRRGREEAIRALDLVRHVIPVPPRQF